MAHVTPTYYAKVLYDLTVGLDKGEYDRAVQTFLDFLRKEERMSKIEYIIDAFIHYAKKQKGIREVSVTSARALEKKEIDQIAQALGGSIEMTEKIDSQLIGGMTVRVGDTIMDGSVRTQLRRIQDVLQS